MPAPFQVSQIRQPQKQQSHGEDDGCSPDGQPAEAEQADENQGPEQIELFLDRQRPGVPGIVDRRLPQRPPIVHEIKPAEQRFGQQDFEAIGKEPGQGDEDDHHHRQRGIEPHEPAQVEILQADAAALLEVLDEQRRDEKAAHREEDVHIHHCAAEQGHPRMGEQHAQRQQAARAVQACHVAERVGDLLAADAFRQSTNPSAETAGLRDSIDGHPSGFPGANTAKA